MNDPDAINSFLARLSENARHLRANEDRLPPGARPLALSAVHDLEQSAEELRATGMQS